MAGPPPRRSRLSLHHLDALFRPTSVAVIGASDRPGSLGALVMHDLLGAGFAGPVWPVNLRREQVAGLPACATVEALPQAPDLAVICTPPATVPGLIAELGRRGTRAAIVLTAGLRTPAAAGGATLEQAMLDAARPHRLRILGPNCLGLLVPGLRLNASFAHVAARPGRLAFVSQSGALATAMLAWADARGIGFSHFISLGDSADVDFGDVLDWLAADTGTRAILLYIESVKQARKFMSAARAAARNKPVIVVKAGRAPEGAKAAASHTGALAGSDLVFDAAVRRAGMLRVDTLEDLFDAAETLARARPLHGERLTLLTNGGGAGVLAADALALGGGQLAPLGEATLARLDAVLPPTWSRGNPVDIVGDAPVARYTAALKALLAAPETDALLLLQAPTAIVPSIDVARACLPLLRDAVKPVLTCWLGGTAAAPARQACAAAGVPTYETPERAALAFQHLVQYRRNQEALMQPVPARADGPAPDVAAARALLDGVLALGRHALDEVEAKALLAAYGVPVVDTRVVADAEAAVAAADRIGYPVVLKILSPQISHKSDVGGVALGLGSAAALRDAAAAMLARVRTLRPDAELAGFTVQAMVNRPRAHELIVGLGSDAVFGPVLLFGQGGTAVEVLQDRAIALPPLNVNLAAELVGRTRVARLLAGYRDRSPVDRDALHAVLVRVAQMACDLPQLAELDINPLLADEHGVIALDARVALHRAAGAAPLAIAPYPAHLEEQVELHGQALCLRPVRAEDEALLHAFYGCAPAAELRLHAFVGRMGGERSEVARCTQLDYDREFSLVAVAPALGAEGVLGEVRSIRDPDGEQAQFAILVRADWQHRGLGHLLMARLLHHLRQGGVRRVSGACSPDNQAMQALAARLGFAIEQHADEPIMTFALEMDS